MRLKCLLPLSLPVLLLPYAVLEQQLMIPVLWILPHSSILLPFSEEMVPENIWSVWLFFILFYFLSWNSAHIYTEPDPGHVWGKKCLLSSDFFTDSDGDDSTWTGNKSEVVSRWFEVKDDRSESRSSPAPTSESNMAALHIHSCGSCRLTHVWLYSL